MLYGGGDGADTLSGGAGGDTYQLNGGDDRMVGTIAGLGGDTLDGFIARDSIEITDLGADPQIDVIGANTGITFAGGGTLMINGFSGTLEREGNVLKVAPQVGDPINPDVMTGTLGNDTI